MSAERDGSSLPGLPGGQEGDDLLGSVIAGKYRIVRVLGRGGMGVVFEALHQDLAAMYAVKVLGRSFVSNDQVVARFFREARTVAQLGHPHIVAVHDLGVLPDGRPYLTMDLVSGRTLKDMVVARGVYQPDEVARLLGGVADALGVVHSKGIVHRDIKLENIMLAESEGSAPVVKLLDFGVAAVIAGDGRDSRITQHGWMVGTPLYLPPEAGLGAQAEPRWDVYALGVVTYALMTARWPFDGDGPMVVMSRKMAMDAPRLSVIEGTFSERVEEVVGRALSREPSRRYPTARAFVDALADASKPNATPLPSPPISTTAAIEWPPAPASPIRRPWPFAAAAWAGALVVLAVMAWWIAGRQPPGLSAVSIAQPPIEKEPEIVALGDPVEPKSPLRPVPVAKPSPNGVESGPAPRAEVPIAQAMPATPAPRPRRSPLPPPDEPPPPRVPTRDPLRAQALTQEGMRAIVDGMLPRAITLLRDATLADPDHGPAWRALGLANDRMGLAAEARQAYRRYLEHPGSDPAAVIAKVRARLGELEN